MYFFFFKQKTAYEMRISDWSSDVCSSDLLRQPHRMALEPLGQIMGGGLSFQGRVHRQHDLVDPARGDASDKGEIGRASCRERVCQYVSISVVAVSLKKKRTTRTMNA